MKIGGLLHVNIRCTAKDLPAIERMVEIISSALAMQLA